MKEPYMISAEKLRTFGEGVFQKAGVPEEDAKGVAEILVEANLRMDELFADLKSQPKGLGVEEILVPGEPEWRTKIRRKKEGCPIREEDVHLLRQLGQELGVPFPA